MNTEALIFDMDGTLWDSTETVAAAWNKVISESPLVKKAVTADEIKGLMGKPLLKIGKELFPDMDAEKRDDLMKQCCEYENELLRVKGGVLYNGLEDTLKALQPVCKLFIVSNCQAGYIESFLEYHKLGGYFTDFQSLGYSGKTKGDNIVEIIRRNNVKSAYYVGDTRIDYEATRKACIPFIFAAYGFGEVHNYEYKINSIIDLQQMFK